MSLVVHAAIDHVLCLVGLPGEAHRIARGRRRAGLGVQRAAVGPDGFAHHAVLEPQFVHVVVGRAIEDVLGLVVLPGEAGRFADGGRRADRGVDGAAILPFAAAHALVEPYLVDVVVHAAIDHVHRVVFVPGVAQRVAGGGGRSHLLIEHSAVGPLGFTHHAVLEPQFVDLDVRAAIDDVLRLVALPGETAGRAGGRRRVRLHVERAAVLPLRVHAAFPEP